MRKIPASDYLQGLTSAAVVVTECDKSFGRHYDPKFQESETSQGIIERFRGEVASSHQDMAELNKHLDYLRHSFFQTVETALATPHKQTEDFVLKASAMASGSDAIARLRLPEDRSEFTVTCPTCRYQFAYNTTPLSFRNPAHNRPGNNRSTTQGSNWIMRLCRIIGGEWSDANTSQLPMWEQTKFLRARSI